MSSGPVTNILFTMSGLSPCTSIYALPTALVVSPSLSCPRLVFVLPALLRVQPIHLSSTLLCGVGWLVGGGMAGWGWVRALNRAVSAGKEPPVPQTDPPRTINFRLILVNRKSSIAHDGKVLGNHTKIFTGVLRQIHSVETFSNVTQLF